MSATEICIARPPRDRNAEGGCNVTGCELPVHVVTEVGGGWGGNTCTTLVRLCRPHGMQLGAQLLLMTMEGK